MIFNNAEAEARTEYEINMFRKIQREHFGWKMIFDAMALACAQSSDYFAKNV